MTDFYAYIKSRYLNRYMTVLVKKKAAEKYDLRYLIQNQVQSARLDGTDLVLEVSTDDYLVASFNELIRFAGKGLITYEDFCLEPQLTSRIWRYVTLYYSLYFFAVSFGRIAGRSAIYINSDEARRMTMLFSLLANTSYTLKAGNYVIRLDKPAETPAVKDFLEVRLSASTKSGSHESSWSQLYLVFNTWKTTTSGRSLSTVNGIINCLKKNTSIFSEARNRLNYRGQYTLKELDNQIVFLGPDKRGKSLEQLEREISAIIPFPAKDESATLQTAHSLGIFFYMFFKTVLGDLCNGQPHPGSHYVKQLAKRLLAP